MKVGSKISAKVKNKSAAKLFVDSKDISHSLSITSHPTPKSPVTPPSPLYSPNLSPRSTPLHQSLKKNCSSHSLSSLSHSLPATVRSSNKGIFGILPRIRPTAAPEGFLYTNKESKVICNGPSNESTIVFEYDFVEGRVYALDLVVYGPIKLCLARKTLFPALHDDSPWGMIGTCCFFSNDYSGLVSVQETVFSQSGAFWDVESQASVTLELDLLLKTQTKSKENMLKTSLNNKHESECGSDGGCVGIDTSTHTHCGTFRVFVDKKQIAHTVTGIPSDVVFAVNFFYNLTPTFVQVKEIRVAKNSESGDVRCVEHAW